EKIDDMMKILFCQYQFDRLAKEKIDDIMKILLCQYQFDRLAKLAPLTKDISYIYGLKLFSVISFILVAHLQEAFNINSEKQMNGDKYLKNKFMVIHFYYHFNWIKIVSVEQTHDVRR
ncbi:hypothetical protein ACJX0J_019448, partial [Zea mays]